MLLQALRQSTTLARWVLVWFVLAMGVAVAAPTVQPLTLSSVCSAAGSGVADDGVPDGAAAASHHTMQCVLCLGLSAPPLFSPTPVGMLDGTDFPVLASVVAVDLPPRHSPLTARAPPLR